MITTGTALLFFLFLLTAEHLPFGSSKLQKKASVSLKKGKISMKRK
jgi:hypothetical protein